ncbi:MULTISPECIES: LTA synthase family protein [Bacillus]|uniref:LTA synthase family protein n=1 Tax=Bacillus TaxID=1386 RepID=UPI000422ED63|nr:MULTISPECIES: LTA synthase family protein [Bacillus]QHZ48294.1 LTA synthase family protein [Bacillus sp. NSP9.1]WFA06044.1 LTA synthase family protein [Bacillus sp. HSf4]
MKRFIKERGLAFFLIAAILLWLKTYAAYVIEFNLGITNTVQQILLFVNPISSSLFFLGLGLLFKKKIQQTAIIVIHFLMSFLLYANIVYYRFFSDFITLPTIMQARTNGGQLGDSIFSLMHPLDVFYFIDTIILIGLAVFYNRPSETSTKRPFKIVMGASVLVFLANLAVAEMDRPELLTRSFDRNYLVKYLGTYNFTIYDAVQNIKSNSQRALASSSDVTEVENYIKANQDKPNAEYFGKAKGMNVVYISMESLQTFLIDYKLDGKEVTPFLNSLAHDDETFYFDNFFHQTGQGKTSDAEFMMDNSLYPLAQGSVFINKAQNTLQSAPAILKSQGYTSAAFHGNYKTFWNRNEMYKAIGYDKFFDATYYDMSEDKTKNYGMKDKPFFKESMPLLKSLKQPFYTKFISLSNHFPFEMDEGDTDFPAGDTGDSVVDHYFQSAHYMDQALEQFFNDLKKAGLYDNTIVVMYGDHYGISENHNKAMSKVLGKEITPYENAQLQRVPLFIHAPGVKGIKSHKYGGEVDVAPTLLHLMGVNTKDYLMSGSDLLSPEHREVIPFRNGDFVSPEYTKTNGHYYDTKTGELLNEKDIDPNIEESVKKELEMSDKIVDGDLLRFYKPKGFKAIDPSDYDYTNHNPKTSESDASKTTNSDSGQ